MPSTAQPAPETDEKKSRGLGSYLVWAFVALMVYVLSSGPMFKLVLNKSLPITVTIIYGPLLWARDHTLLQKPLDIYWRWWERSERDRMALP